MPYGADSKRIVLTVASGAGVRPAFPASGRRQRLNPFRRRFARRFRPDQLPLALNQFRQTSVAKPVQPGNTTRPRFVDRLSPVPDRAFGIRPHHREKTFVVAIALSPPPVEIRIAAIDPRLAVAVGLASAPQTVRENQSSNPRCEPAITVSAARAAVASDLRQKTNASESGVGINARSTPSAPRGKLRKRTGDVGKKV